MGQVMLRAKLQRTPTLWPCWLQPTWLILGGSTRCLPGSLSRCPTVTACLTFWALHCTLGSLFQLQNHPLRGSWRKLWLCHTFLPGFWSLPLKADGCLYDPICLKIQHHVNGTKVCCGSSGSLVPLGHDCRVFWMPGRMNSGKYFPGQLWLTRVS